MWRVKIAIIVFCVAMVWQQGGAQVVNSIGEENMKVPQGM